MSGKRRAQWCRVASAFTALPSRHVIKNFINVDHDGGHSFASEVALVGFYFPDLKAPILRLPEAKPVSRWRPPRLRCSAGGPARCSRAIVDEKNYGGKDVRGVGACLLSLTSLARHSVHGSCRRWLLEGLDSLRWLFRGRLRQGQSTRMGGMRKRGRWRGRPVALLLFPAKKPGQR